MTVVANPFAARRPDCQGSRARVRSSLPANDVILSLYRDPGSKCDLLDDVIMAMGQRLLDAERGIEKNHLASDLEYMMAIAWHLLPLACSERRDQLRQATVPDERWPW